MTEERAGWAELVRRHGGVAVRRLGEVDPAELESAALLGLVVTDTPHAPALARLPAAKAVASLVICEEQAGAAPDPELAGSLLNLLGGDIPAFLLNDGWIGGGGPEDGALRATRREANELLDAAMGDEAAWELDPDFGYEAPLPTASLVGERAMITAPRLIYAANDRVYDHAALVPAKKEEWHAVLAAIGGLDPAIVAASGWPVEPTGSSWRPGR